MMIRPGELTLDTLRSIYRQPTTITLDESCWEQVAQSHQTVLNALGKGRSVYGINTGFGLLASKRVSDSELAQLQLNLVRSHCAGTGDLLPDCVVRLIIVLKLGSLARGYSGVRPRLIESLVQMFNAEIMPCIPAQGSVGASGDLAPLAHLAAALLGESDVTVNGRRIPALAALRNAGIAPVELAPKEGLALLNGTQVSTALALAGLFDAERNFEAALVAGAMSVDAAMGSDTPFDARIHEVRNHPEQIECARRYRELLQGSAIRHSHVDCDRVQDPYSLRCQPQVMGSCLSVLRNSATVLSREANAVSDNPLVFADDQSILSGGNFHAEPVAMAADQMAIAIAEIGALSERRIALLIDHHLSELPAFLVKEGGLNSGFMIPQVTAVALAGENKHLAAPVSVDSLPTSANQEDHVSMATYAARRLTPMNENLTGILAIELLAACQGVDFRTQHKTSPQLQTVHAAVRKLAPFYDNDRPFTPDIEAVRVFINSHFAASQIAST